MEHTPLTTDQVNAVIYWMNQWEQLKGTSIPIRFRDDFSKDSTVLTEAFLMEVHPQLSFGMANDLLKFCNDNTIFYQTCYGHGQIMFHKWLNKIFNNDN